jgi:N-acetylglucosamine-6-phosphate deacetylase
MNQANNQEQSVQVENLMTILQFLYQDGTASTLPRLLSATHYEHIEHFLVAQDALSLLLVSH